ncbi:hypothetical protein [Deinococcus hopiensis]|uniref:hypothetical protein n=1 Tax=Deinococcus hopiensis TaxID=309885 RepID=UPI001BB085E7|nr:hypothetical protein [Deinococcus hopiensis]
MNLSSFRPLSTEPTSHKPQAVARRAWRACIPVLALTALGSGHAAPADFVGTWTNANASTQGITRVVISRTSTTALRVQVFGKCSPTDCDWGQAPAITYGANVQDADHRTASAVFRKGFSTTLLVLRLSARSLSVQSLTEFTDGSGRQNYASEEVFRR